MTDADKMNMVLELLEGGNAARLARRSGVREEAISRVRHGKMSARVLWGRILDAYPELNRDWLLYDRGEPLAEANTECEILRRINDLSRQLDELKEMVSFLSSRIGG